MFDTSCTKARFSLRKTTLGLLSALLGVFMLWAYLPYQSESVVYAQENIVQQRSVSVHYVLESDLTEQEKLAVTSGLPKHAKDGDVIYFVYQSLKQDLPKTSDERVFWLSLVGLGLAGGSLMAMKGRKQGKGVLGLSLILVGGLSVTVFTDSLEHLTSFNQSFVLNEHEALPRPQDIAGYRYLGYICKASNRSDNLSKSDVTSTDGKIEKVDAISDTVTYSALPKDAPSLDLPIHDLSEEFDYEVVLTDYPTLELPTYEVREDTVYSVVPEASPIVDLPVHELSEETSYEVVPTDYPTLELPTYEVREDTVYSVIPEASPIVDLPVHELSEELSYEVVPTDYPTLEFPTYELREDTVYSVVPEASPIVDLPVHELSEESSYEVVPSDYPTVESLPIHELSSDLVYTVVPESVPSVDLPSHTLSLEAVYEVVPTDYPTEESLPNFDLSILPKTTDVNDNWVDYVAEDGSERRILWAKGVKAPRMGADGDFKKSIFGHYVDYKAPFVLDNGWYDANKRRDGDSRIDASLCFAAVSTNMLYWWLDQNKEEVGRYLEELEKSGYFDNIEANTIKDLRYLVSQPGIQQDSTIYNLFVNYFYDRFNGYQSDILMDFFINGYAPKLGGGTNDEDQEFVKDQRAGFFNAIFGNKKLTKRQFSGSYQTFSQTVKTALENNQLIGMEHLLSSRLNHIVTLWGAEFDADDRLVAVYVTDSDDQDDYRELGMKRYLVKEVGGRVKVTTDISQSNNGSNVEYLHILSLGKEYWKVYFEGKS